tara:strand:- start:426 stop:656 length:231 start_codon:yes stop_codon:yes gene_type:complete
MSDNKMTKEQEEYSEITVSLAKAADGQVKNVAKELSISYSDAATLFQVVTNDKLVYLLTQVLSSDGNRNTAPEESK